MRTKYLFSFICFFVLAACPENDTPSEPSPPEPPSQPLAVDGGSESPPSEPPSPPADGGNTNPPTSSPTDGGSALPTTVTYNAQIAPILAQNCVTCHRQGGVRSETPLDTFAAAAPLASTIKFYTENRLMPPWYADNSGSCGSYRDALWLTEEEIELLGTWADDGAPEGIPTEESHEPPSLASLEEPTTTVSMTNDYFPSGSDDFERDDYRCFVVDPEIATTKYLTGFEVVPGNINIVHHVLLYRMTTVAGDTLAAQKAAAEAGEGYTCFGGPGLPEEDYELVGGWAPGTGAVVFPDNSGIQIEPNHKMVMQLHYNFVDDDQSDKTALKLKLENTVSNEGYMRLVSDSELNLAPGQSEVSHSYTVDTEFMTSGTHQVNFWGLVPHMHQRGVTMRTEIVAADGTTTCINDVPYWDFNWQWFYFYSESVPLLPGEELKITCVYNTSADTSPIYFGEGTNDEMCVLVMYGTRTPL
ncbi:MAG: hypothetical protein CMH56_06690 [Myxococcales bacterium]|nr:hypothetical protein [Myxococcales bacterium]|tara:strand:- start:2502 stop:3917 length:1416 start_codon:yes stop_codon:yes gene_type:complete